MLTSNYKLGWKYIKFRITVNEIELIFERLIEKIKNDGIEFLDLETDYYWIIASDEWDNFESSPDMCVGSLVDDWNELQKILNPERMVTYVDCDRFASILRAVSETINPTKKS